MFESSQEFEYCRQTLAGKLPTSSEGNKDVHVVDGRLEVFLKHEWYHLAPHAEGEREGSTLRGLRQLIAVR